MTPPPPATASGLRGLVPTRALVLAALLPVAFAVLSLAQPGLGVALYALDAALCLVFVVDAARCRADGLLVERRAPRVWSAGRGEKVELTVRNRGARGVRAEVQESLFAGARPEGLPAEVLLGPGGQAELAYRVTALRRGRHTLGAHHLRVRSPWGFWHRQVDLPATDEVQVWPDVKQLSEYDLLARQNRQGLLTRTIRRAGSEAEFDRLRPYQRGDEYRLVDWKATARARQPIARQLRQATDQNVVFLVDMGRAMTAETDGRPALDYALDAMLLVAHVALRNGDRVGMIAFDDAVRAYLPPAGGERTRRDLLRQACALEATLAEPDYHDAFVLLRTRVRRRSLVVLFSNLVDDSTAALLHRRFASLTQHLVVWVCVRDPALESLVAEPAGADPAVPWTRAAAAEVLAWRRAILDRAAAHGVLVLDCAPGEFTPQLLGRYLEVKSRQLL